MQNQITFAGAIKKTFKSWRDYRGVSTRREYWFFVLFTFLLNLVTSTLDRFISAGQSSTSLVSLSTLVQLALYVFVLPLLTRRYHDAGLSGFWQFLVLIPIAITLYKIPAISSLMQNPALTSTEIAKKLTDAQAMALLNQAADAFGLVLISAFLGGIFQLVITLLPSRPSWRGNRYAPVTQPEPVWGFEAPEHLAGSDDSAQ